MPSHTQVPLFTSGCRCGLLVHTLVPSLTACLWFQITVPFRYEWIQELFKEVTTLVFFVFTGYKFRPASNNPYLQVPGSDDEDDDSEMDTV